jgi:signal recognition particle subunit SRP54
MQQMKKMGPLSSILEMLPGGMGKQLKDVQIDEKDTSHIEAIIRSMTIEERRKPIVIKDSRKKRIAKGSGTTVQDVGRLLKQFEQMQKMMKQFTNPGGGMGMLGMGKQGKKGKKRGLV